VLREDGTYVVKENAPGEPPFNIHKEFYNITKEIVTEADLF
jgi:polyphosphate kinase